MKKLFGAALALAMGLTCAGALAACDKTPETPAVSDEELVQTALSGIKGMYISKYNNAATPNDYALVGQYPINGEYYPITWTVNVTEGAEDGVVVKAMDTTTKTVTIDVNEVTREDILYELTASITYGEHTGSFTFKGLKVATYIVNTHAEYIAAAKDDALRVTGTVTGITKKGDGATYNCIYLEDADGGYYVYNLSELHKDLAIGKKVTVSGKYSPYNGTHELVSATVEKVEDGTAVTPTDITDLVKAAADNKAANLVAMQGQLVTINKALLCTVASSDNSYYGFKLGNVTTYLRISSSDCPTNADNQAAIKTAHAENLGKTATVTGVVSQYSGAFYIVPVNGEAFKDFAENTTTPAEKIAEEKAAVTLTNNVTESGDVNLPTPGTYTDVTFEWASDNEAIVIAEDGSKMTVTVPEKPVEVKITLTISCGDAESATKEFTVKVGTLGLVHAGTEADPLTAADVNKIFASLGETETYQEGGKDKQVYIEGFVTDAGALSYNSANTDTYGLKNVYIAAEAGTEKADSVLVYSINWGEALTKADENPLQVGDYVVVKGFVKTFRGTKEVADGTVEGTKTYAVITSITKAADVKKGDVEGKPLTAADVKEIFDTLEDGQTYQVEEGVDKQVYIKGIVTDAGALNGSYGLKNIYIADEAGTAKADSVLVYNVNWGGAVAKANANPLKVGDTIIVKGYIKIYNGTKEVHTGKVGDTTVYSVIVSWTKTEAEEEEEVEDLYTLSTMPAANQGTNNSYTGNCDVTVDGITWNIEGNAKINPWRFGGKSITDVDRKLTGKTAINGTVAKLDIEFGDATITVNSVTLKVYSSDPTADGATAISTVTVNHTKDTKVTVTADKEWTNCYYQLVFNVTNSSSSNQYVTVSNIVFY